MIRWNSSSGQPWMSVCVCVRESVCVCVCVKWWGWKGRGCKCWSLMGKTLAITSSPSSIPPLNHHPPLLLVEAAHAVRWHKCQVEIRHFRTSTGNGRSTYQKKRIPANQDVTDCLPKLFEQHIVAVSVNEKKFFFFFDFLKKSGKSFSKNAESKKKKKKKKRNFAEKWKTDIPDTYDTHMDQRVISMIILLMQEGKFFGVTSPYQETIGMLYTLLHVTV